MGAAQTGRPEARKYTVSMILSFGPAAARLVRRRLGAGAAAACWPLLALSARWPLPCASERERAAPCAARCCGWLVHALAIVVDIAGIGSELHRRALRLCARAVGDAVAGAGRLRRREPLRALAGRAPHARRAGRYGGGRWPGRFPASCGPQALSRWAPLHWVLGIASYGLFGAAVLHGAMLSRAERQMRSNARRAAALAPAGMPLLRLERLTFRFVAAGFVVLSAALLLGAWFANPWRWDHKTVFSMLGWVVFAGAAGRAACVRLARPARHALAVRRRRLAAAGLRGLALRARSAARTRPSS